MSRKWSIFLVKHHIRVFCALMILGILGFKFYHYGDRLSWYQEMVGITIIMFIVIGIAILFWVFFIREPKTKIRYMPQSQLLQYRCPFCDQSWDDGKLPKDGICPKDGMPLKSFDPVEDRNTYRL